MEVFPLEDVNTPGEVGGPGVSQVEQMKSWDDSFTQLEKALQAAYETKEVRPDINNFTRQLPAALTVSAARAESPSEKSENKRKWADLCSSESDDCGRAKFKRTSKLLPGGLTITLVGSSKENTDVSDTLMRLVSDVKDSEPKLDVKDFQSEVQDSPSDDKKNSCEIQGVETANLLTNSHTFENEEHVDSSKEQNSSSELVSGGNESSSSLKSESQSSISDDQDVPASVKTNDTFIDDELCKSVKSDEPVKCPESDAESKILDSSTWHGVLDESDKCVTMENQDQPDFPKTPENGANFESVSNNQDELTKKDKHSEKNLEKDEQTEKHPKKDEQSEKNSKKDEQLEKSSKKDDKLKKKKFERCNIRDIKLEDELDAVTLSAQKEEQERIKRLQEAQMRALQERLQIIEVEKEALSQLFSQPSADEPSLFSSNSDSTEASEEIDDKSKIPLIKSETDVILLEGSDDDKKAKLEEIIPDPCESEENVIDISSSSSDGVTDSEDDLDKKDDDIMVLSDEGEPETGTEDPNNSGAHTNDCFNLPDHEGRVLVNVGHPPEDPDIFLAPQIAKVIKPHQIGGIRFLYDNVVENLERYKSSTGFGCILAHSMGLGKTVQVVSFVDVFLRHTPATLVLCIVPINTIQNWKAEFDMWVPSAACVENEQVVSGEIRPRDYNIYTLNENFKTMAARASLIAEWRKESGVLLMGYEMYRMLALRKMPKIPVKKGRRLKKQEIPLEPETTEQIKKFMDQMYEHIVIPGPDLVICDEGHRIKNSLASTSMALKSIKTRRRVVLTGYPLQNNLLEYWCMVDFVRPNYLGSRAEFCNMFERPISNGQCIDSTPRDRQLMRFRSHVLHSLLVGFVQRRGHSVLRAVLPKKEEHVLLIRMTPIQRKLYKCFVKDLLYIQQATNPLKLFAVCCKIWNHPDILYKLLQEKKAQEDIDLDIDLNTSNPVSSNALMKKKASTKDQKSKMLQRPLKCPAIKMQAGDLGIQKSEMLPNQNQTCKMLGPAMTIKSETQSSESTHLNQQNSQQLLEMSHDTETPLCKEEYPLQLQSSRTQPSQNHVAMQHESGHNQFPHGQYTQKSNSFCQAFSQNSNLQQCQPPLPKGSPQYLHQSQSQQYSSPSHQPFSQQFSNSSLPQSQYLHQSQNTFPQMRNNQFTQPPNGSSQSGNQSYPQPPSVSSQVTNVQQFSPQPCNESNQVGSNQAGSSTNINNNQYSQKSGGSSQGGSKQHYTPPTSVASQIGNNQFSQSTNNSSQVGNNTYSQPPNVSPHGNNNQQFPMQTGVSSELGNNHFSQPASVSPQLPNNPQYPQTSCASSEISNFAPSNVTAQIGNNQQYSQPLAGSSQIGNNQFPQSSNGSSQVGGSQQFSMQSSNTPQVGNNQQYPQSSGSSVVGSNQQYSQSSDGSSQIGNNQPYTQPSVGSSQVNASQQYSQTPGGAPHVGNNQQFPQHSSGAPQVSNNQTYSQQSSEQPAMGSNQQYNQITSSPTQGGNNSMYPQQLNGSSQILPPRQFPPQHSYPIPGTSQVESNFTPQTSNQESHQQMPQFANSNSSTQYSQQFSPQSNSSQASFNQESSKAPCPIKHPPQPPFNQKTQSQQYLKPTQVQQYGSSMSQQSQQQYTSTSHSSVPLRQHGQQSQQMQKYNEQSAGQHKAFSDEHNIQQQYSEQPSGEGQQSHEKQPMHQNYAEHSVQSSFTQHTTSQPQFSQRTQSQQNRPQQPYSQQSTTLDALPPFSHPSPNQKVHQQPSPQQHFPQQQSPQYSQQSSPMQSFSQCSPLQQQFPQQSPPLQQSTSQSQFSLPSPTQQSYPQFPQQASNPTQYLPQSSHPYPQESSPQQQYSQAQYNHQSSSQPYPQHSSPQQFQQQSPKQTYTQQFLPHGQQYPRQPSPQQQSFMQQPRQSPFHMTHQQQYNQNMQSYKPGVNSQNFAPQSPGQTHFNSSSQTGNSHQFNPQQQLPSRPQFQNVNSSTHSLSSDPYSLQMSQPSSPQIFNQQPVQNSSPPQYCQSSQPSTVSFIQPSSPSSPTYSQPSQQCHQGIQNKQYHQSFMQPNAQSPFQQYQSQLPQSMQLPAQMHSVTQQKSSKQTTAKSGKSLAHLNLSGSSGQSQLPEHTGEAVQSQKYQNFQNNSLQVQSQSQNFQQTNKASNISNQNYQPVHGTIKKEHFTMDNINEENNPVYTSKCSKTSLTPVKNLSISHQNNAAQFQQENCKTENESSGVVQETVMAPCRDRIDSSISYEWAIPLMKDYVLGVLENSHKMMVLFAIIDQTLEKGDKLLVFSQSLSTLDLLEHFLGKVKVPKCYSEETVSENWCRNKNYFRLDGSTSAQEREKLINEFNRNENISLFLLSTRAGCLGINLVGANRIVVMDASWNPCHDAQAVCRIYRYGQKKQCHIYRLVTDNSLEKRIYDRQVNKQGMSDRVVDELNPESNFTWKDVTTLIQDDEDDGPVHKLEKFESSYSDDVLKYLVSKMSPSLSKEPFEHESLLLDRKDLKLTKQEKRLAKQSYEMAKRANMINIRTTYTYMPGGGQFIINNKQGQWVGGTTVRVLPGQARGGGRAGTTATPITASPSLMNSLFKQGVMVQKLTIPSNISIPVLTPGAPPVVIPAGQDVLVLRTPKGVYLRLPDGRIIAVQLPPSLLAKTQFRPNVVTHFRPTAPKGNQSATNNPRGQSIGIIKQTLQCGGTVRFLGPKNSANSPQSSNRNSAPEVIDLSDDDDEPSTKKGNMSMMADEVDSTSGEQDQNCGKQATTILPGKQITIRKVSPTLQQGNTQYSNTKDKCDLPMKLQQNQQITIMPINTSVQPSRQKLAPQLAQPVRVQQMLLQPQQGKRKPLSKNATKIQLTSFPVNKNFQRQITVTPAQNQLQIQKVKHSPSVPQSSSKTSDNVDQTIASINHLKNSTSLSITETTEKGESYHQVNVSPEFSKCKPENRDNFGTQPVVTTCTAEKDLSKSNSVPVSHTTISNASHGLKHMADSTSHFIEKRLPQNSEHAKSLQQNIQISSAVTSENLSLHPSTLTQVSSSSVTISQLPQTLPSSVHSKIVPTTQAPLSFQGQSKLQQHNLTDSQFLKTQSQNVNSSSPEQNSMPKALISESCNSSEKQRLTPQDLPQPSPPQQTVENTSQSQTNLSDTTSLNPSVPKLQTPLSQVESKTNATETSILQPTKNVQNELMTGQMNLSIPLTQSSPHCFENSQNGQLHSEGYMQQQQQQLTHFHQHSALQPTLLSSQAQQSTNSKRKKSTNRQTSKKSPQQQIHTPLDTQGNRQNQVSETHQFPCSPLSEHLHDRFQPFTHPLQNSDFQPFQSYATHKSLLHIQHPQPLHPLQHSQEHSLASHLSHIPHIYPMSPHLTGNPCISDIQPQGPRAWPVPQSSMSSFHPFGQSSQYYSSSHESSQYPFQPSSFTLSQPTSTHVPQPESNIGVLDHVSSACSSEL